MTTKKIQTKSLPKVQQTNKKLTKGNLQTSIPTKRNSSPKKLSQAPMKTLNTFQKKRIIEFKKKLDLKNKKRNVLAGIGIGLLGTGVGLGLHYLKRPKKVTTSTGTEEDTNWIANQITKENKLSNKITDLIGSIQTTKKEQTKLVENYNSLKSKYTELQSKYQKVKGEYETLMRSTTAEQLEECNSLMNEYKDLLISFLPPGEKF